MTKGKKKTSAFVEWVNGERNSHLKAELHEAHEPRRRIEIKLDDEKQGNQLLSFFKGYHFLTTLLCLILLVIFLWVVLSLPNFGDPAAPTNNEVSREYLVYGMEKTGSENAVTAMIFTYRGFDTLGESCVLFLAASAVMMLLYQPGNRGVTAKERLELKKFYDLEPRSRNYLVTQMSKVLVPFIMLYGLYVLIGGENSPGGGFSAGAILSGGLILYRHAFGHDATRRFLSERVFTFIRTLGLCIYAGVFAMYIVLQGGDALTSHIIMPIDVAVGMVVMCTMYGFYSLFMKGEI
ncbi:MAG: hypothetical protein IKR21_04030 [Oscillospiraceae bacterium]|nr:hypothetical protein [Oscillospiraceae bacterium]